MKRAGTAVAIFFAACSGVHALQPGSEVEVLGLSTLRSNELAMSAATNRALARATWIAHPDTLRFSLTRQGKSVAFKLFAPETPLTGVVPQNERLHPFGARSKVMVKRTAEETAALAKLKAVHVQASARGLDLSVAQMRAERSAFETAVLKVASDDAGALSGTLTIVNYHAESATEEVTVSADVAVRFGAPPAPTNAAAFDVEREEVEDP